MINIIYMYFNYINNCYIIQVDWGKGGLCLLTYWTEKDKKHYLDEAESVFDNVIIAEENKKLLLRR